MIEVDKKTREKLKTLRAMDNKGKLTFVEIAKIKKMKLNIEDGQEDEKQTKFEVLDAYFPVFFSFSADRTGGDLREVFLCQPYNDEKSFAKDSVKFENLIVCSLADLEKVVEEIKKRKVIEKV